MEYFLVRTVAFLGLFLLGALFMNLRENNWDVRALDWREMPSTLGVVSLAAFIVSLITFIPHLVIKAFVWINTF